MSREEIALQVTIELLKKDTAILTKTAEEYNVEHLGKTAAKLYNAIFEKLDVKV